MENNLEIISEFKRNYNVLRNDSYFNITNNCISKFENNVRRENRNSKIIINLVEFYYKNKNKITFIAKITIVVFLVLLLFLILVR